MPSDQHRKKRDRLRGWFKKIGPNKNTPTNEANSTHVVLSSRGSTIAADDVGRSTPSRNEDSAARVDTVETAKEDRVVSNDDGRSTSNHNEEPSVAHNGAHVDAAQPSAATSIPSSDVDQATPSREKGTSAAQSGSNVDATPVASKEIIGSAGGGTAGGTPAAKKEKEGFASYFGTGALVAGTVAELSDAIPPLKIAMDVLKVILENASALEENKSSAAALRMRIQRLEGMVEDSMKDSRNSHSAFLKKELDKVLEGLPPIVGKVGEREGLLARSKHFVFAREDKSRIRDFIAFVDQALSDYKSALISDLHEDMRRRIRTDDLNALNVMNPVTEAMHNASSVRTTCLPGTRVDILHKLEEWAKDPNSKQIYWLNGHAGSGKSTIAQSLAERLRAQGRLGASFFCSRNSQRTSDLSAIFRTIAFQLARTANDQSETYRKSLLEAISTHTNPDIATFSLNEQLQCLILVPANLSGIETVVIIDALDECVDDKSTSAILDLLSQHAARLPDLKVKFFITSRPESHIRSGFRLMPLSLTDVMIIHEVAANSIAQDIRLFLNHNFLRIAASRSDLSLPASHDSNSKDPEWPKPEDIDALVIASAGLFIFAATIIKYIDAGYGDPEARLNEITNFQESRALTSDASPDTQPFCELDNLYLQILRQTSAGNNVDKEARKAILGLVVVACAPVSIATITRILGVRTSKVRSLIRPLHSVLLVPNEDTTPLSLHHKSFADFLVDLGRCRDPRFLIVEDDHHHTTAVRCLDVMKGSLKKNICGLPRYSMNSDLSPDKIDELIDSTLRYCSQYWAEHLTADHRRDQRLPEIQPMLENFLSKQMLMWFEVMSLIGDLPSAVHSLAVLKEWLTTLGEFAFKLLDWTKDGYHFVLFAFDIISASVAHIYHSALPFAPERCLLKRAHASELRGEARLLVGAKSDWEGPLRVVVLPRHSTIRAIKYSHDGTMFALGTSDGHCLIVQANTGAIMFMVKCEPLGPEQQEDDTGAEVAENSDKSGSLRSGDWDNSEGSEDSYNSEGSEDSNGSILAIPAPWNAIDSLSFSFDDKRLAVCAGREIMLLDVKTGMFIGQPLYLDHQNISVVFCPSESPSHNSLMLISSDSESVNPTGCKLYLWNTVNYGATPKNKPVYNRLLLNDILVTAWCFLPVVQGSPEIVVGLSDGRLEIRSLVPWEPLPCFHSEPRIASRIIAVASANTTHGSTIAAVSKDGDITVYIAETSRSSAWHVRQIALLSPPRLIPTTNEYYQRFFRLHFSPDASILFATTMERKFPLYVFHLDETGVCSRRVQLLNGFQQDPNSLGGYNKAGFSPNSQRIVHRHPCHVDMCCITELNASVLDHHSDRPSSDRDPDAMPVHGTSILYIDREVAICRPFESGTGDLELWDVIHRKRIRTYTSSPTLLVEELRCISPVRRDRSGWHFLLCERDGAIILCDFTRTQPVVKRWEFFMTGELHVYDHSPSTIRFCSYRQGAVDSSNDSLSDRDSDSPADAIIELVFWTITSAFPTGAVEGEPEPCLHKTAVASIDPREGKHFDSVVHQIQAVYHQQPTYNLAGSSAGLGVDLLLELVNGGRYLARLRWNTTTELGLRTNMLNFGAKRLSFVNVGPRGAPHAAMWNPIDSDNYFRQARTRFVDKTEWPWVVDGRDQKRLWVPSEYRGDEFRRAHGSVIALKRRDGTVIFVDFSSANLNDRDLF